MPGDRDGRQGRRESQETWGDWTVAGTPRRLVGALIAAALAAAAFPAPAAGQGESDFTEPVVHVPANVVTDATSAVGAQVFYIATATNNFSPDSLTCTGPSGAVFPVGTTAITCYASDVSGNVGFATFTITVRPGTATNALTSATTQILDTVTGFATQGDLIALLSAIATPPTVRKCDKKDDTKDRLDRVNDKLGNRDTCFEKGLRDAQQNYTKYVEDASKGRTPTISPTLATQLLAAAQLLATETLVGASSTPPLLVFAGNVTTRIPPQFWQDAGATSVLYTDRTNPPPYPAGASCNPRSGTQFPLGTTTVTCTAQTTGGTTTGTFTVTVQPRD
ncbi:MAG TPA: HYR domain-containing protein [Candidatus Limnocylindria bacterium]|nr:HYR domain-containing protein [Candidatus Limnocylindria bacterium]